MQILVPSIWGQVCLAKYPPNVEDIWLGMVQKGACVHSLLSLATQATCLDMGLVCRAPMVFFVLYIFLLLFYNLCFHNENKTVWHSP